jgi:outer membrane protein OmpA-like peptidoglycan-associated protein
MKNLTLLTCLTSLLLWGFVASGQNQMIQKGDQAYKIKNYYVAISYYEKARVKSPYDKELIKKLADCYRFTNQYAKALEFYDDIVDFSDPTDASMKGNSTRKGDDYFLIDMLIRTGDTKQARQILGKLNTAGNPELSRLLKCCNFADSIHKENYPEIILENIVTLNSKGSDFGVAKLNDKLVFASNRIDEKQSFIEGINNKEFSDLYLAKPNVGSYFYDQPELMKGPINSAFNNGTFTHAPGKNWALITQCKKNPDLCSIYKITQEGDKWTNLENVKIDLPEFNYGHPSLTSDGKTVYFASDRPLTGKKGENIWKATYDTYTNSFHKMVPVPGNVNTDGDEVFPFILNDSILLYASTGLVGMGGLDIYKSVIKDGVFGDPVNLGFPVNSTADDFSIIVNNNLRGGYFCSNRENETQSDDIYYSTVSLLPSIIVKVTDANTHRPVGNALLSNIPDDELKELFSKPTDGDGVVKLKIAHNPCDLGKHKFTVQKEKYLTQPFDVPCNAKDTVFVSMNPIVPIMAAVPEKPLTLSGKVFDVLSGLPVEGAKVVMSNKDGPLDETKTDKDGKFAFYNVPKNDLITLTVSKLNYYTDAKQIATPTPKGAFDVSNKTGYDTNFGLRAFEPPIVKDIFYDFDKADLRLSSILALDTIVRLFRLNPELKIIMESHCDERGSVSYNNELSKRRGAAVFNYLVNHGVNSNLLDSRAFGKSRPVVTNAKTDEDHQKNRRTEFKASYLHPEDYGLPKKEYTATDALSVNKNKENIKNPNKKSPDVRIVSQTGMGIEVNNPTNPENVVLSEKDTIHVMVDDKGNIKEAASKFAGKSLENTNLVFRIQIAATKQPINVKTRFAGIADLIRQYGITENEVAGYYKYQVGNFTTYEDAEKAVELLVSKGYKDCFVLLLNK